MAASPESTVTSLLSSSGHLRSGLEPAEPADIIRYGDQDYESASAALDAYIKDFDRSGHGVASLAGTLVLPRDRRNRVGGLRNRDVLRERLTDWELDYLNLPAGLHRRPGNRLSMTTDELLSIHRRPSNRLSMTTDELLSIHRRPGNRLSMTTDELLSIPRDGSMPVTRTSAFCLQASRPAPPGPDLHLPRWLTGNKARLDSSDIGSVPDLSYPPWLRLCDLTEEAPPPSAWEDPPLEELGDLRLQLAEQISLLATNGRGSDVLQTLSRGNRIETLIQKADQVLTSLSRSSSGGGNCSGTDLSGLAGAAEAPPPGGVEVQGGGLHGLHSNSLHGNSLPQQPGPVEGLKQMLFRLQALEAELQSPAPCPAHPGVT
ncbi:lung adenoma susceptibility protein 2 [Cololabis saira]|uniref:lung adenoma susceptibility protein 2 n=1 Tax=Cololabis saira TaxID=129043 RepID=UPI002AD209E2|nr:lung adenoma susceptibility protein 2 [Cololabis saira]